MPALSSVRARINRFHSVRLFVPSAENLIVQTPMEVFFTQETTDKVSSSRQPSGETRGDVWRTHGEWERLEASRRLRMAS